MQRGNTNIGVVVETLCHCAMNYWGLCTSCLVFLMFLSETDPVDPEQGQQGLLGFSWGLQRGGALVMVGEVGAAPLNR